MAAPASCPAGGTTDAAVNSAISFRLDRLVDPVSVGNDGLRLTCGGAAIDGSVALYDDTLVLTPAGLLPSTSTCTAELAPSVRFADGDAVGAVTWSFRTGSTERNEWRFTDTRAIFAGDFTSHLLGTIYRDGRLIVARREASTLVISVSTDAGETFQDRGIDVFREPTRGLVDSLDMAYRDGVLHLVWRVLYDGQWADIFYSRSTNVELNGFSEPVVLTVPFDALNSSEVAVEAHPDGRVYLAWDEFCDNSACSTAQSGIYFMIRGSDGSVLEFQQLSDELRRGARLLQQSGSLFIFAARETFRNSDTPAIFDTQLVEVFNYDSGFLSLDETGPDTGIVMPIQVDALSDGTALVSWWNSSLGDPPFAVYFARFDAVTQTLSDYEQVASIRSDGAATRCSVVNVNENGRVSWLLGAADTVLGAPKPARVLSLSSDKGMTFDEEVRLDFMGTIDPDVDGAIIDELCPAIEVTDSHIHAIWLRNVYDEQANTRDYALVNARASIASPCSRPDW